MNDQLSSFHDRVNGVIYNPFINLKDLVKEFKKSISHQDKFKSEILRLDAILVSLDDFEILPYGNLERIKGFNKMKSHLLKIIKEISNTQ